MRRGMLWSSTVRSAYVYAAAAVILPPAAFASTPLFEAGVPIPTVQSGGAISTAAHDLDLDGMPEIITAASSDSSDPHFRIHSRDEAGGWTAINVLTTADVAARADRFGGDSFVIDMNGDSYPDILLPESPNDAGPSRVSWFANPADGSLSSPWEENVIAVWDGSGNEESPAHMSEIFAGDMDGDGDTDVVTRDVVNGVYLLENNGGTFARHFLATNPREGLALFDPDQDGDLDVLLNGVWFEAPDPGDVPNQFADLSDTAGFVRHDITADDVAVSPWYPDRNRPGTQAAYASKVAAADLNGDGLDDVVITNSEELTSVFEDEKPEGIAVYLADSPGGTDWTEIVVQATGTHFHTLDIADIDLDGDLDLLSGVSTVGLGADPAEVLLFLNSGDGTEWERVVVDDRNIYSGVLADVDADGDVDIVGPENWRSGQLSFYESNASDLTPQMVGDFNGDRTVDDDDYQAWQEGWGEESVVGGPDGNNDGVVNAADYTVWRDAFDASVAAVPEPRSSSLLGLLIAIGYRRFRFFVGAIDAHTRRA
ncbi:MAG: FG-GAP-like repeat-containing protein [Planctomycetota bacterium]